MSNRDSFDDELDYPADEAEGDELRDYAKKAGRSDVRRGIDDYFESKRQRDGDNFLFDE